MKKIKNTKILKNTIIMLIAVLLTGCAKLPHSEELSKGEPFIEEIEVANEVITSPQTPEKVKVRGKEIVLEKDVLLKKGDKLNHIDLIKPTGTFETMESVDLLGTKGWKVLHVVPSLDTPVCSMQTKQLNAVAEEFKNVEFITISADLPFAQRRFIVENNFEYMKVLSDFQGNTFAKENGLFMPEFSLMARAIIILDEHNEIQYVQYAENVDEELSLYNAINFVRQQLT